MSRASRNDEEVLAVSFCESAVAFGDIKRNRDRGSIELIGEVTGTAGKCLSYGSDLISEINRFLIDIEVFEHERHCNSMNNGTGDQEIAVEQAYHVLQMTSMFRSL